MARGKKARRAPRPREGAVARGAPPAAAQRSRFSPDARLAIAAIAVVLFLVWQRARAPAPRGYDEYYHVALARQMWDGLRIHSFWWTPFSTMYERFVDGAPLFHLLLMPFARLPLERALLLGAALGQVFAVAAFAWTLRALAIPRPWWFVAALPVAGTLVLRRLEMCRPHVWLIGFSFLVLALISRRRWKTLVAVCAFFGLTHTGGWIAVAFAALWTLLGVVRREEDGPRFPWQPLAATSGGWLLGQLFHPELPANFGLFWVSNFVIPFHAAAGASALQREMGSELLRPDAQLLAEQWPALLAAGVAIAALWLRPQLRSRTTLTVNLAAFAFLLVGALRVERLLELGAPLVLLGLALIAREWRRAELPAPLPGWGSTVAAVALAAAALSTLLGSARYDAGKWSPPREMARWLGEHGNSGERVFTVQWADSGPLFYSAPQLQSLVALDPTVFALHDPALFALYSDVVRLRQPDPLRVIRERFGARWVTVWKAYPRVGMMLQQRGAAVAYADQDYVVFDLGPPPAGTPRVDPRRARAAESR